LECLSNDACIDGLDCSIQTGCLSADEFDLECVLDCFEGDEEQMIAALLAVSCVIESCADVCD
jgi:hypothetical protein